jgi:uracil-DNA glycosylase family 4
MPEEIKRELLAIADALDGLLRWETELSGDGFPSVKVGELLRTSAPPARANPAPEPPVAARPVPAAQAVPEPPATVSAGVAAPSRLIEKPPALHVLQAQAAVCTACGLHSGRTTSVFARGNPEAELVFVGEGPGYHEDQAGEPFVGQAGQLLDKMIVAMGYGRDDVYICNVVKCRPPDNRTPLAEEAAACEPYLRGQLANVNPRAIVALGKCATEALGCMSEGQKRWRGVWSEYAGIPVMPTYHPAFLLRSPQFKRDVWEDLQVVMSKLGRPR